MPIVKGANNTSSGFLFLHIHKSSVMCIIVFSPTSIIHVEITDSSLTASKLFQHFREGIVTLSINRCTLFHSCSIVLLKNVCYIKITDSTFIYTQHGNCQFLVRGSTGYSRLGEFKHVIFQGREDP